jgi:type II secretory pathway pseudopilin PulG
VPLCLGGKKKKMKAKSGQSGITLTEMTVVIAVVALLAVVGVPAIRAFVNSFQSGAGARSMISAALSSARAIAASQQHYAGVRFQKAYHENPLKADQYMIFIVQDPGIGAYFFRAAGGLEPIKLPDTVGVMDLRYRTNPDPKYSGDDPIDEDGEIDEPEELRDTTSFSIIFSPSGKLVIHDVRVRNKDGERDGSLVESYDDIFNKDEKVEAGHAMFYQDDYADLGLGQEASRRSFIIYERDKFGQAYERERAYSDYLENLKDSKIYINPYTGRMIND